MDGPTMPENAATAETVGRHGKAGAAVSRLACKRHQCAAGRGRQIGGIASKANPQLATRSATCRARIRIDSECFAVICSCDGLGIVRVETRDVRLHNGGATFLIDPAELPRRAT